jgi:hypothetical protein
MGAPEDIIKSAMRETIMLDKKSNVALDIIPFLARSFLILFAIHMTLLAILLVVFLSFIPKYARAHDAWADNTPVPPWVKTMCCGDNDAHRDAKLRRTSEGIFVVGLERPVDPLKVFDSLDGHVWAFYNNYLGSFATTYCLFIPPTL